jgi:predicted nucleic acid-binding protein
MIVVDANVIAYAVIPGARTPLALSAIEADAKWVAPPLWRSELRNVLASSVRTKRLTMSQALAAWEQAVGLVVEAGIELDSARVLRLSVESGASAYDCEYVALAQTLALPLVTADERLARRFADVAVDLARFVGRAQG